MLQFVTPFYLLLPSVLITGHMATTVRIGYIYSDEGLERGMATFRFTERYLRKAGVLTDNVTMQ